MQQIGGKTQRYLLFDSGCPTYTDLAMQIEGVSGGWLTARSLHDKEMQHLLDLQNPNWKWEPMIVEQEGDDFKAVSGLKMRALMVSKLGVRKALKIWHRTRSFDTKFSSHSSTISRRQLGKLGLAALVAGILFRTKLDSAAAACSDCSCVVSGSWYCGRQCSPPDCPYYDRKRNWYHLCCTDLNYNCYTTVEYICQDCSC